MSDMTGPAGFGLPGTFALIQHDRSYGVRIRNLITQGEQSSLRKPEAWTVGKKDASMQEKVNLSEV